MICPRCLTDVPEYHSPDSKECSDNCIVRYRKEITVLTAEVAALRKYYYANESLNDERADRDAEGWQEAGDRFQAARKALSKEPRR